jgi:hypothetical protein
MFWGAKSSLVSVQDESRVLESVQDRASKSKGSGEMQEVWKRCHGITVTGSPAPKSLLNEVPVVV